ncbi:Gluconolactonase [Rubellimicrobium mesophilum DSM 19309]|uniref:Gluconolactonase n=1 Tax=Rubellimicrobium mesophilum DSM 19309 TaxID=442562 RepID=A0A017HM54_9RHOB|nr:SMP-30/gluconolactonase/LRE family protein [Rubellimicrobium mesophilum]EYD75405.1 Gluconolactonase [Rubellimicrobium mesophilum DSM 19309]
MAAELALASGDIVGESLVWDDRRGRLVWVDIIGRRIQTFDPATGEHRVWPIAIRPTSLALGEDGSALVGSERHVCHWAWDGEPEPLVEVEPDLPDNRLNEGAVGPDGAMWVGTMHQNIRDDDGPEEIPAATGRLYRYAPDGTLACVSEDLFGITNTLVWPAPDRLVTADTLANAFYEYRIGEGGQLSGRKVLMEGFGRGAPDGSTLDVEGFVWNARVAGGACLVRIAPDGRVDRVVELPCSWPTSCAFGGGGCGRSMSPRPASP